MRYDEHTRTHTLIQFTRECLEKTHTHIQKHALHRHTLTVLKWTDAAPLEAQRPSSCSPASQMGYHWYLMNILHSVKMAAFQVPTTAAALGQMIRSLNCIRTDFLPLSAGTKMCENVVMVQTKVCVEYMIEVNLRRLGL